MTDIRNIGVAIVIQSQCVLVGTRSEDQDLGGFDEFPGGKCFSGEAAVDAAVRECMEETGLPVKAENVLLRKVHTYDHATVDVSFVLCTPLESEVELAGNFRWVPIGKLLTERFPAANAEVIERLKSDFA